MDNRIMIEEGGTPHASEFRIPHRAFLLEPAELIIGRPMVKHLPRKKKKAKKKAWDKRLMELKKMFLEL